ncbi:hypothetical protein Tco_1506607 [Tanacetum coccineum]
MTCGALYTADFFCSKGGLEDKIFVPKPPQNCATCGNPVDGLNCRSCAFVRKCLNEGWYTIHDKNEILNTSESSNINTNVVSAPQEPFVVNKDPGQNSSQNPPQINNNCCYKCCDSLDDIFCPRCTCKSCGKGAHYGYNCPPQIPIISNPEPCYNLNLNEILQNLQSLQQQSFFGNGTPTNFSTPYSSNNSLSFANHPSQPQYVPYSCELGGNESNYGYDCPLQVPFVYNQDPCFDQNFNNTFPQISPSFPQQNLCCENCGGPRATFQCQPMNEDYYEQNSCYDPNSFDFDQYQPPQVPVNYPPQETRREILQTQEDLMEAIQAFLKEYDHIHPNEKCMALLLVEERFLKIKQTMREEQNQPGVMQELLLKLMDDLQILKGSQQEKRRRHWDRPLFYNNDDDEYTEIWRRPKAITPEEPVDSLIMRDEHLGTIPEKESDELIKSSVENLVRTPSESEDFSDNESECDVPFNDETSPTFTTFSNPLLDSDDDFTSSDDDSLYYPHSFNVESNLIESLLNRDILIDFSHKFDFLLKEFSGELAHIDPILPGIKKADFDLDEEIRLDSDSHMEEIDLFLASNDLMPPGIEDFDYDSEGDIRFLEELLSNDSPPFPENESPNLDHFSSPRPPPEPSDVEI